MSSSTTINHILPGQSIEGSPLLLNPTNTSYSNGRVWKIARYGTCALCPIATGILLYASISYVKEGEQHPKQAWAFGTGMGASFALFISLLPRKYSDRICDPITNYSYRFWIVLTALYLNAFWPREKDHIQPWDPDNPPQKVLSTGLILYSMVTSLFLLIAIRSNVVLRKNEEAPFESRGAPLKFLEAGTFETPRFLMEQLVKASLSGTSLGVGIAYKYPPLVYAGGIGLGHLAGSLGAFSWLHYERHSRIHYPSPQSRLKSAHQVKQLFKLLANISIGGLFPWSHPIALACIGAIWGTKSILLFNKAEYHPSSAPVHPLTTDSAHKKMRLANGVNLVMLAIAPGGLGWFGIGLTDEGVTINEIAACALYFSTMIPTYILTQKLATRDIPPNNRLINTLHYYFVRNPTWSVIPFMILRDTGPVDETLFEGSFMKEVIGFISMGSLGIILGNTLALQSVDNKTPLEVPLMIQVLASNTQGYAFQDEIR